MPAKPPESDRSEADSASRPESRKRREDNPLTLVGAGFEFAGVIALMTLCGWWLDGKFGTGHVLMLIGLAMSVIGGTYKLWKTGKRFFD